jgi:hypothetical protein
MQLKRNILILSVGAMLLLGSGCKMVQLADPTPNPTGLTDQKDQASNGQESIEGEKPELEGKDEVVNEKIDKKIDEQKQNQFKLVKGSGLIGIGDPEVQLNEILGKGVETKSWVDTGEDFAYLKGAHEKIVQYEGVEVRYIKYQEETEFKAIRLHTKNNQVQLFNGLEVGDPIEKVLELYPKFKDEAYDSNEHTFEEQDMELLVGLTIKISNAKVSSIQVGEITD